MPQKPFATLDFSPHNYPTPDELRLAHRIGTALGLLRIVLEELPEQGRSDREQVAIAQLSAAILHTHNAQRLLLHEGD